METQADYVSLAEDLLATCQAHDYCGHDPFDGLNSTMFRACGLNLPRFVQVGWLQFHKRSPWNFRRFVGVPRRRNPKGIALVILGLIELWKATGAAQHLEEARALGNWLLTERVDRGQWKHSAWGYPFDWAARAFFVPEGKPNAITTCYVARALGMLGELLDEPAFREVSADAGLFLDSLYLQEDNQHYYGYIPGEEAFVHNASLWAAAMVSKSSVYLKQSALAQRALDVARQSVSMQLPSGAWRYGTRAHHQFIDSLHTGYNLEALHTIRTALGVAEFDDAIVRGLRYYRRMFFTRDGTAKYYHDKVWPIDTHCVAQALITLLKVGGTTEDMEIAQRVLDRAITTLYMPDQKRFVYQRQRFHINRTNYLRWTQAWAFHAIGVYANATGRSTPGVDHVKRHRAI